MSNELYIPKGAVSLDKVPVEPQIRLGLQGPPGSGKTWCATTFPNPVFLNLDRGLGAHAGRSDIVEIPFWSPGFVDSVIPRDGVECPPNRKDAIVKWIHTEGSKLGFNQTLVIDSNTQLQNAYHAWYKNNQVVAKSGKIDAFAEWSLKTEYFGELMELLKTLKCHIVYICHETDDRNKEGELNGRIRPLLTGQFADQLASHFTDYFRCHAYSKPKEENKDKFKAFFNIEEPTSREWINSTPKDCGTIYLWQTQSDEIAKHVKTSTLVGAPKFVLANYSTFNKYKRKA